MAKHGSDQLQDLVAYPPRLLRAESAARYLGMGTRTFLRLVSESKLPKPKRIGGVVAWDRYRLDAFVDDSEDDVMDNTVDRLLRDSNG
jgi:predicted DNA-binding transcriptional regulator AlpA